MLWLCWLVDCLKSSPDAQAIDFVEAYLPDAEKE